MRKIVLAGVLLAASLAAVAETATYHTTKTFAPKPGGTLKVEASFQDVTVALGTSSSVEITVDMKATTWPQDSKESLKAYEPVFSEEGNTLLVRCKPKGGFTIGFSNSSGVVAVKMPPGMNLDLSTGSGDLEVRGDTGGMAVTCETGSGDVSVEGALRAMAADTGSGDVRVKLTGPAATAKLHTGSGDVTLAGGAERFEGNTGSGSITAEGLTGPASFETGSGDVKASWVALSAGAKIKAETGSGDIGLTVPSGASLAGSIYSSSGDIRTDFPGASSHNGRRWSFSGGPGAAEIAAETGSGNIGVLKGS